MAKTTESPKKQPGNWVWVAPTLLVVALLAAAGLGLQCWAPTLWAQLTGDEQLANAVVSTLGSLIGTLIAVAAAYAILRHQLEADRQLELDLRIADVAHEVAGEISYWRDALPDPVILARGSTAFDPAVVRALVRRRDRLESHGVPAMAILRFIRVVARDLASLRGAYDSISRRLTTDGNQWAKGVAVTLEASSEISAEWRTHVVPHVDALDAFATALATWQPGQPIPPLALPDKHSLVCSMVDIEKRLSAAGHEVPRDVIASQFGLYDDIETEVGADEPKRAGH